MMSILAPPQLILNIVRRSNGQSLTIHFPDNDNLTVKFIKNHVKKLFGLNRKFHLYYRGRHIKSRRKLKYYGITSEINNIDIVVDWWMLSISWMWSSELFFHLMLSIVFFSFSNKSFGFFMDSVNICLFGYEDCSSDTIEYSLKLTTWCYFFAFCKWWNPPLVLKNSLMICNCVESLVASEFKYYSSKN